MCANTLTRLTVVGLILSATSLSVAQEVTEDPPTPRQVMSAAATYNVYHLAQRRVPLGSALNGVELPGEVQVSLVSGTCRFAITDGALVAMEACPEFWVQREPRAHELELTVADERAVLFTLTPELIDDARLAVDQSELPVDGGAAVTDQFTAGEQLAVWVGPEAGWTVTASDGARVPLPPDVIARLDAGEAPRLISRRAGSSTDGLFAWSLVIATPAPSEGEDEDLVDSFEDPTLDFCPKARRKHFDAHVICVDATAAEPTIELPGDGVIVRPNRSIVVVIRLFSDHTARLRVEGEAGVFIPGQRTTSGDSPQTRGEGDEPEGPPPLRVIERKYPPRLPGQAIPVKVLVRDASRRPFSFADIELLVDQTYSSAFRVGFGGVFLGGVDRKFEALQAPGSGQAEIVSTGSQSHDMELVLGFAPFLEEGGRSYARPSWTHFAPYVGVGVISQKVGDDLDYFKSLHLGVEWEMSPTFSVAGTMAIRRVTRLAPGYEIGGPVAANGDIPTVERQALGLGLMINVSPDFLRFVNPPAGGGGSR